jgi:NodT family efflux transporter outer membrane factor (OMF) lipoprotein
MTIYKVSRYAFALAGVAMLSSCHIYKKFEMPTDDQVLSDYVDARNAEVDSTTFGNITWQEVFTDPQLANLIERALVNNVNLQNAKLNVDMAQSQLKGARLSYLPSLTLAASGSKSYYDITGMRDLPWSYQVPLAASWEIDVFGKTLNTNRRAKAAVLQSEAYQQAVRSQIIAGVANCYYTIAMLEKQLEISRETEVLWGKNVQIMKDFKEAGRVTEAAVVQSAANHYSIKASITDLEVALNEANNAMSLLLNVTPQTWGISADAMLDVPEIVREGVPMRELSARPDVRAAEQSVAVAYYATNQARAAFYPSISISATGGFTNTVGTSIINPANWFANLAGSLTAPLFARGQLISNLEVAKASQAVAMNNFENTIMSAAAEVSDAYHTLEKSAEKSNLLSLQVAELEKSVDYTLELLSYNGTTSYLEVLTAQQTLLQAQLSKVSCDNTHARAAISLYQALGGGR